ncbi:MAG: sulfatase-like hydrolase/transferase [Planctomycetes bacterium]|nr:sulfatase-like hydrolase/transferase [Planctomycetota bacterium]
MSEQRENAERPNVILVYTDQQRYDTLGINGNDLIQTPNLDAFGRSGVHFRQGYVNSPICLPSRVALFTGRYTHTNRSYHNGAFMSSREDDMATAFREGGYTTALIGKDHCFGTWEKSRLPRFFDHLYTGHHLNLNDAPPEIRDRLSEVRDGTMQVPMADNPLDPDQDITGLLFADAREYLEEQSGKGDRPFFLWLSIPDPHPPYMVCEPYSGMYDDLEMPRPAWREGEMANKPYRQQLVVEWDRYNRDYPGEEIDRLRCLYWGMVSYIDDEFGKLMQTLEGTGLDENTIVIFTADHGDYMGDHRMIRKGPHVYESLVHVPLIVRWANEFPARSTDALACNVDIFPTLCDLCGVEQPEGVQGRNLSPLLRGDKETVRDALFFEHGFPGQPVQPGQLTDEEYAELKDDTGHHLCRTISRGRCRGVRWSDWKYVYNQGDVDELYDLREDYEELFNLADLPEYEEIVREGRDRLLAWEVQTEDPIPAQPER